MTNVELDEKFREIVLMNDNIFDRYCALASVEGYEDTPFAKLGYSIKEAFEIYLKNSGIVDTILGMFTNPDLDLDILTENLTQLGKVIGGMQIDLPETSAEAMKQLLKEIK